jgi:hypothetical protein
MAMKTQMVRWGLVNTSAIAVFFCLFARQLSASNSEPYVKPIYINENNLISPQ